MRRVLVGLLLALAVVGCRPGRSEERPAAPAPTVAAAAVEREAPICTAAGTVGVVKGFFAALSAGRVEDLDAFFAPAGRFQWYANSVPPGLRLTGAAKDRGSLLGYLKGRQARHERITVDAVDFNGYRAADRTGHFAMLLRRTADDIRGRQLLGGKGAVDCDSRRLMVVGIGLRP
jgi:hypothetical protein